MAEKPRLKDPDEIFSSIGKRSKKHPPLPSILGENTPLSQRREPPSESAEEAPREEIPPREQPSEQTEAAAPAAARREEGSRSAAPPREERREPPAPKAAPEPVAPLPDDDKNPLDFGKYQLPDAPSEAPPAPRSRRSRRPRADISREDASVSQAEALESAVVKQPAAETAPRRRRSAPREEAKPRAMVADANQTRPTREQAAPPPVKIQTDEGPKLVQPYQFEEFFEEAPVFTAAPEPPPPPTPVERRKSRRPKAKAAVAAPAQPPETQPAQQPAAPPQEETDDERESFLKRLSSQFEEEFTQRFEGKDAAVAPAAPTPKRKSKPLPKRFAITAKRTEPERLAEPSDADGVEEALEADSFLEQFSEQVREEEQARAEEFKETLAEKFERERERYLKELGIGAFAESEEDDEEEAYYEPYEDDDEPAGGFQPPARRKLDLQIRPEMHGGDGAAVTYDRLGDTRPLEEAEDEEDYEPTLADLAAASAVVKDDKKTSEQLLLELATLNSQREAQAQKALERQLQKQYKFVNAAGEEEPAEDEARDKKARGSFLLRHRVALIATVATLFLVLAVGLPVASWLSSLTAEAEESEGTASNEGLILGTAHTVRESRDFEGDEYDDILIKRSNISVKNLTVRNYLVIEDFSGAGNIHLENVSVGGALYLQNCELDSLSLHNVSAERIVIANSQSAVDVSISGFGLISTVEVKTPANIQTTPSEGAEGMGVQDVVLRGAQESETLNVTLNGMDLATLASYGQVALDIGDSYVQRMSVEGSLNLSGEGKVLSVTVGPFGESTPVLAVKDTEVSYANVKGPASINVSAQVDALVLSDDVTVNGSGRIAMLTLDTRADGGRLLIDLYGLDVQTVISNAEARVNAIGGARVGELTANSSVYALGSKVSHLVVNADNVIYEYEPDKITVATGIKPPESMADNPNLDYNLSTSQNIRPLEAEDDDIATVCGHSRDNGGFLVGDGSRANPYEVATPAQLAHVSAHLDSHFVQTADIDISDDTRFITGFDMIAAAGSPFSGSYDGNGYSIYNLRINSGAENIGLFAENNGTIQNVHIASGEVRTTTETRSFVGGVVGLNRQGGVVEACANEARVSGNANSYVGGIVGDNYGGRVRNSYNVARISSGLSTGGIVGMNRNDAVVSGCYNVGDVDGEGDTGSVVGANEGDGVVTNCYYLLDTAPAGVGRGSGTATGCSSDELTSSQMVVDLSAGSDASPWTTGSGSYTYPTLRLVATATRTQTEEVSEG